MICGLVCDGCRPHADGICTRQAAWRGEVLSPPPDGLWVPTVLEALSLSFIACIHAPADESIFYGATYSLRVGWLRSTSRVASPAGPDSDTRPYRTIAHRPLRQVGH